METTTNNPTTLLDVANLVGVSRSVAGCVLNGGKGNSRVSEKTALRIRDVAAKLNYCPNPTACILRGKRSYTFGLLVASAGDPLRSFLVQYLDRQSHRIGCRILIGNTAGSSDLFDNYSDEFSRRSVDGILCAVHHWCDSDIKALLAKHPNTVFYEAPGIPGAAHVTVDREEAVRLATRRLIEQGRRRIGLAVMSLSRPTHTARLRGYEAELKAHGLSVDKRLIFNGESYGLAFPEYSRATQRWEFPHETMSLVVDSLVRDGGADAIVAHDDFWAAALINNMRARSISVPNHVAVVGYLNHYLADWVFPALTTIDLQHDTAARKMVELLEQMITEGPLPENERAVKIKPRLIVRESA